jgi:hypothetical protein
VPAHLTLFRQLPPSAAAELDARLARAAGAPPPPATVVGIIDLGEGTALRVESEALEALRSELAEALHGLLTPQDSAPWRAHVTVQNKVETREARRVQAQLRAALLLPRPLAIKGLASWHYLGGAWELAKSYSFRG